MRAKVIDIQNFRKSKILIDLWQTEYSSVVASKQRIFSLDMLDIGIFSVTLQLGLVGREATSSVNIGIPSTDYGAPITVIKRREIN